MEKTDAHSTGFFTSGDGISIRYGVWPAGMKGKKLLLLNGRTEFLEKYLETIGELNDRGYDVYSLDWRGQGLSGRLLPDRKKGHVADFDEYMRDLKDFIHEIIRPEKGERMILLGHSMGGHMALRILAEKPFLFERAVLSAPMIRIRASLPVELLARVLAFSASKAGAGWAYMPGSKRSSGSLNQFDDNPFTSDPERFAREKKLIASNPDLEVGGVTLGWLAAAFRSMDMLLKPEFAKRITTPVLIVSAGQDRIVDSNAHKRFCAMLSDCRRLVIAESRHEILMEQDFIRRKFWHAFDVFLFRKGTPSVS